MLLTQNHLMATFTKCYLVASANCMTNVMTASQQRRLVLPAQPALRRQHNRPCRALRFPREFHGHKAWIHPTAFRLRAGATLVRPQPLYARTVIIVQAPSMVSSKSTNSTLFSPRRAIWLLQKAFCKHSQLYSRALCRRLRSMLGSFGSVIQTERRWILIMIWRWRRIPNQRRRYSLGQEAFLDMYWHKVSVRYIDLNKFRLQ